MEPQHANGWIARAERHADALPGDQRKQRGAWFTPMALALPTARRTLAPLIASTDAGDALRICDPAVGGGAFLLAASAVVPVERHGSTRFVGRDIDAAAAAIASDALAATAPATMHDVATGDGLLDDSLEPASFDCVLTNPPWETLQGTPATAVRVAQLRRRFRLQGTGKLYTYRLFFERALELLRPGGRLGMVVPASLWFDRDAEPLRRRLLDECDWQWLFGFENRERVFAIDGRYRFGVVIAEKGRPTHSVRVAFGRTRLADWQADEPQHVAVPRSALPALSPTSGAFVEVEHPRDVELLQRMQALGRPLCGDGGAFAWRQGDFNMTSDVGHFVPRERAEALGFAACRDGTWRDDGDGELLPLLQGAMIHDLDPNAGWHAGGTGHKTRWEPPADRRRQRPLFLVDAREWRADAVRRPAARVALRALSNATNARTAIACLVPDVPCGNSLGVLTPAGTTATPLRDLAALAAVLSSLAFDWTLRLRLIGTNLNAFVLSDCVLPRTTEEAADTLARAALQLCAVLPWHEGLWRTAQAEGWGGPTTPALDASERRQLHTAIDLLVGRAYGLERDDVAWITRGCGTVADRSLAKGFWRLDRDLPCDLRRPNRWLAASAREVE